MTELLAPAGSVESLRAAVNAGADAVYIGGNRFGARAYADNPDEEQLKEGIDYCHLHGKKLYMTVNTLFKQSEITEQLYDFLLPYYLQGADGLIVQDLGAAAYIRRHFPGFDVHASTQMTITGSWGARLMKENGITRVVPARELSLQEIKKIIDETGIEVETFIHGAMCYCYSGQCLLSSVIGGRSGNRGRCAQPCRLPYSLSGKNRKSSYLLSMKDMCTLELLPDIIDAGIASLKIEGRMKRPEYTAGVVSIYRKYIDLYQNRGRENYQIHESDLRMLMDLYNRGGFSDGYYKKHNGKQMMSLNRPNHQGTEALKIQSVNKKNVSAAVLENLNKQDVIELFSGSEIILSDNYKKGETTGIHAAGEDLRPGMVLYRTKNEALLKSLRDTFILINKKEKIKGSLRISRNAPAILKLTFENTEVCVEEKQIAEIAQTVSTPVDTIIRQIKKTGNTPFEFDEFSAELDNGLFVSVKGLNELRRRGLETLYREILSSRIPQHSCRVPVPKETLIWDMQSTDRKRRIFQIPGFNIYITSMEQLRAVLRTEGIQIHTLYFDFSLFTDIENGIFSQRELLQVISEFQKKRTECYFWFPPVFREKELKLMQEPFMKSVNGQMDGMIVHTVDQMSFAKQTGKRIAASEYLYAYNMEAVRFLQSQGITRRTLPAELNYRELLLLDTEHTELNVYGHQPLMQSAQCIIKNTSGCTHTPQITFIRDRKNAEFPVLNKCAVCCNTLYNSVPLQLGGCREEIKNLNPEFIRISFTIENERLTKQVLRKYYDLLILQKPAENEEFEGTRGHFKRGVE